MNPKPNPFIRFAITGLLIGGLLIPSGSMAVAQQPATQDAGNLEQLRSANLAAFDYVWQRVRDQYWDADLEGVDWEAARTELRPQVAEATTRDEGRRLIRELVDRLEVSHFGIIPEEVYKKLDKDKPRGRHETGIDVRIVDDQVLVTDVRSDSPADNLGVKTGWKVVRIGETDIQHRFAEVSEEIKDHPHRRTILFEGAKSRLMAHANETIDVEFRDGNDEVVTLKIPVTEPRGTKKQFGHIPEFYVWMEVKQLPENIGYIRFNAFMDPAHLMPTFNQAMKDFRDTDGIIIDVRGNGGGMGEMGTAMMGWLLPDGKQQMGTVLMRDTTLKMLVRPRANRYEGRVAVLIDEGSVSAAEFFASGMKDLKLGRLFGTRTAGAVLGSVFERLPNGDGFQYARANYISKTTGKTLEGVGVPPHEEVFHERTALLEGRDLQLERAVQWIRGE